ncbi:MAG: helix-turn-helix transcriptional regulator [Chloroflexi bacterium]|nr:helix-turn-helix transcriptional regulator [Chloroflexota bacterium]
MSLGQAIRTIRQEAGLSQKELAEAAGIDQSYLSMIESDQRRNPGTRIMARLAQALRVSMDELAARAGYLPRTPPPDALAEQALRLFRQLPRWRQEDVVAQLELYLRLTAQGPRVIGGEEENHVQTEQTTAGSQAA